MKAMLFVLIRVTTTKKDILIELSYTLKL